MSDNSEALSLAPLSTIRSNLDRMFGKGVWVKWELETISLELRLAFNELLRDKINLLQVLAQKPDLIYNDMFFFLTSVETLNNKVVDFDYLPMPTSLEIAYALKEIDTLQAGTPYVGKRTEDMIGVISYLLREEGYSEPISPFEFIPKDALVAGQTEEDTKAKKKALDIYVHNMGEL